ncbi:tRNA sulfurtransferase [Acrasis kona]|uniref:tRNA sulfurtransferase n=1 Tax=Acrasis kona TaxID=1008807 RepID=A0AAW2ZHE9_9EUKA
MSDHSSDDDVLNTSIDKYQAVQKPTENKYSATFKRSRGKDENSNPSKRKKEDESNINSTEKDIKIKPVDYSIYALAERVKTKKKKTREEIMASVKLEGLKPENITSYLPDMFSFKEWLLFVKCLEDKYKTKSYITSNDLNHIETFWMESMREAKTKITTRVCTNIQNKWKESAFSLHDEDADWSLINTAHSRLTKLLINHERTPTVDMNKILELKARTDKRTKEDEARKEREEREWNNLNTQTDLVQLKYFINRYGPIKGKETYSDWKGADSFAKNTEMVASGVVKSGKAVEDTKVRSEQVRSTNDDDDEEDIFEMKLV